MARRRRGRGKPTKAEGIKVLIILGVIGLLAIIPGAWPWIVGKLFQASIAVTKPTADKLASTFKENMERHTSETLSKQNGR